MPPETRVLTLAEVAALLRVPKSTVYKLAQNSTVPAFKVGKHWRFLLSDIEGWLRRGTAPLISQGGGDVNTVEKMPGSPALPDAHEDAGPWK